MSWKKLLSFFLAVVMVFQLFPALSTTAWAAGKETETSEMTLDEAMEKGLVQDFIGKPERTEYAAEDVLFELEDLREENVKQFHMADGNTLAVSYGYPVHVQAEDGSYQDIDNRLALYNQDGTLSAEEPDAVLNVWLKNQATWPESEKQETVTPPEESGDELAAQEEELPADEFLPEEEITEPVADPEEASIESDAPDTPAEEISEEPVQERETAQEQEPMEEAPAEVQAEDGEAHDQEPAAEEPAEETQAAHAEPEGAGSSLGDVPEDLPTKVPGPEDSRYYRNNRGIADVSFAVLSNAEQLVCFSYGGYSVSLTPQVLVPAAKPGEVIAPSVGRIDAAEESVWNDGSLESAIMPRNISSAVTYKAVFDQADLQYVLTETALKENIVVQARTDSYVYTFLLETDGLTPVLTEYGDVALQDENGNCIMTIPAGYMYDAAGEYSEDVSYELWQRGKSTYLSVVADSSWINAEERQFPVVIDPSVTINWDTSIEISTICSGSPNAAHNDIPYPDSGLNYYGKDMGYTGMHPNAGLRKLRTLIHVGTLPTIPSNSTVVDSQLKLYTFRYYWWELLPMLVEAHALTTNSEQDGSWCKYHCWNDCPPLSSYVLNYYPVRNETGYFYVDVTREAIKWYNDPSQNYGICLKAVAEDGMTNGYYGYALIASINVAYANIQRPYFTVTYRNTAGVESYYSYQTQDIGRAGAAYVGDYTGQVTLVKGDAGAASTANPVSVGHVYNTAYCGGEYGDTIPGCTGLYANMKLGAGWKLDVQQSIIRQDDNYLVYTDGDGTVHYFKKYQSVYYDEDGLGLHITVSGTNYTLADRYGNSSYFEGGILSYSQDADGNRMTVVRNSSGQITSVTRMNNGGSAETVATFAYNSAGYLTGITNSAGKITSYSYSNGRLTTVTHPDGTTATYSYDANGRLTAASDNESGYAVHYDYHSSTGKLTKFYETAGGTTGAQVAVDGSFQGVQEYRSSGPDKVLNNSDDLLVTCVFDYWGRTINSYTTSADRQTVYGASAAQYTANSGTSASNNRLLTGSSAGVQNPNMASDPGAEGMTGISSTTTPWKATGTASVETGTRRTGAKALKLSGNGSIQQTVTGLRANGWYVLSAYANTSGVTDFGTDGGVYMASGAVQGDAIRWKTGDVGDGWERIYVAAQADASGSLTLSACAAGIQGSVIFDDFQIEETPFGAQGTPSAVSLLDNGAMERNASWSVWVDGHHTVGQYDGLSGKGLRITGIVSECIDVFQNVPVYQPGTQTYLLTAWAKGDSVPLEAPSGLGQRFFCMAVQLIYTDNTVEFQKMDFNVQTAEWQYLVFPIVPKEPGKTVKTVQVLASFGRNPNTVVFDNLALTREDAQTYTYNANGDLTSVTTPGNATPTYTYSGADLVSQVTRGSGTYSYSYDSRHHVTGVSNDGLSMTASYDSRGNTTGTVLTGSGTTARISSSAAYDAGGNRVTSQTDARGNSVTYQYEDAVSQMLGAPTKVTDPRGTVSSTSYNANNGRVTGSSILSGSSTEASLAYTYSGGNLTAMTRTGHLANGTSVSQSYGMNYNAFGQTTGISVGTMTLASYSYAANGGPLQSMSYGNGFSVRYAYDALERVKNIYYNNSTSPAVTYGYAANGALGSLTDHGNSRRYVYGYDGLDRLSSMTETYGGSGVQILRTNYDNANRVSGTTYRVSPSWNGSFNTARSYGYSYNSANGSLSGMTLPGSGAYSYSYDALRRLNTRSLTRNGSAYLTRSYSYLAGAGTNGSTLLVGSLTNKKGNGSTLNAWQYTYDAAGNITGISGSTSASYSYDAQGQLLTETVGGVTTTYVYDTVGNLRSRSSGTTTDTFTYDNANWGDLLTAYNGNPISYDAIGNPTKWYDGATMTWINGRRLASISSTNAHAAMSFTYDSGGLRLTKTVGTTTHRYTWQGSRLIAESYGNTELEFFYDESGQPYALLVRNTSSNTEAWYYYVTNLQGDVVMLLDASGNTAASYSYNAWGKVLTATGTMASVNPIRYRGYYYDSETGLYYLQSRYYDPEICRFINADGYASTGQGILGANMFAYCGNEPVGCSDPSGALTSRQIHDYALKGFIAQGENLSMTNTCIYYNGVNIYGGWGYCDLFDTVTGEVWELKRDSSAYSCSSKYAKRQLAKYVAGKLKYYPDLNLKEGSVQFKKGKVDVTDWNGTYHITYWQDADGILRYDYVLEKSSNRKKAEAVAAGLSLIGTVVVGAYVIIETGGAAAPEVESKVIQLIEIIEAAA